MSFKKKIMNFDHRVGFLLDVNCVKNIFDSLKKNIIYQKKKYI